MASLPMTFPPYQGPSTHYVDYRSADVASGIKPVACLTAQTDPDVFVISLLNIRTPPGSSSK